MRRNFLDAYGLPDNLISLRLSGFPISTIAFPDNSGATCAINLHRVAARFAEKRYFELGTPSYR
ncbi:MAG: hypothetical protein ABI865_08895 [Nitrosospira sp.]